MWAPFMDNITVSNRNDNKMNEKIISVIQAQIREAEEDIKVRKAEIADAKDIIQYIWKISAK